MQNIHSMTVSVYRHSNEPIRKYFTEVVPEPLPEAGDFLNTKGLTYYTVEDEKPIPHTDDDVMIRLGSRLWILHNNAWTVHYSGSI